MNANFQIGCALKLKSTGPVRRTYVRLVKTPAIFAIHFQSELFSFGSWAKFYSLIV